MTHKMRLTFAMSASTGVGAAIAGAILSAAIISGGPAAAAESLPSTTTEMQEFIYSHWAKFCGKGLYSPIPDREVCDTVKTGRAKDGQTVVAAVLVELEGQPKEFHVVVSHVFPPSLPQPRGIHVFLASPRQPRTQSARIIMDNEPAIDNAATCFANNCWADYQATPELVDKLKKGQMLQIQMFNLVAPAIPYPLPLADSGGNSFAEANEGPPADLRAYREQHQDFQAQQHKMRCALCQEPFPNEPFAATRQQTQMP